MPNERLRASLSRVEGCQVRTSNPQGRFDLDDAVSWSFTVSGSPSWPPEYYHLDALGSVFRRDGCCAGQDW
jgi:hypothetical protein